MPLDLQQGRPDDPSRGTDDCIARTDEDAWILLDGARAILEFANEAVVHALERGLLRVAEVQIAEKSPNRDGQVAHQRVLAMAEPADEPGGQAPGNAIGQEEIDPLLLRDLCDEGSYCHEPGRLPVYS